MRLAIGATAGACWTSAALLLASAAAVEGTARRQVALDNNDNGEDFASPQPPPIRGGSNGLGRNRGLGGWSTSKGKGSSKGGSSSKGKGYYKPKARMIYETVEFEIISTGNDLCGSRDELANDLETAFLNFFEEEEEECDSDRDVRSLVLVEYNEAPSCDSPRRSKQSRSRRELLLGSDIPDRNDARRRLQRSQRSSGRFNRRSQCTRCRRRRLLEREAEYAPRARDLGGYHSKGKGGSKGSKGGSSSKGSSYSKGNGWYSKSCSADLEKYLKKAGFSGIKSARITEIKEVNCSPHSKDCTSRRMTRGACCGVYGCACSFPSESLCKDQDYCVEEAQPFDSDFCEDFLPSDEGSLECEKEKYDGSKSKYWYSH